MDGYHDLSSHIRIQENGGVYYVQVLDGGCHYYHDCVFYDREDVFEYIDWCDLYCDAVIHRLLYRN